MAAHRSSSMSAPGSSRKNLPNKGPIKMTPSQLVQRQLSGNILDDFQQKPQIKKFLNLADYSNYKDTNVSIDEPLFEPIPPLIQFTDYEPLQLKEKVFRLRNKDKVVRRVKILQPDSRLFQVQPAPSNLTSKKSSGQDNKNYLGNKIAPGMEACFTIKFSPEAKIDYQYELVVVTEREQFIVPIYAIGKRAMIDFPDILDFGQCPVKYVTEKPIIIRNLGEKTTKWFLTLPQDFEADKKEGVLEYGKNEQIVIKFYPKEAKPYKSEAVLMYDKLYAYVPILGSAQNHVVYLSKSFVQMDEAYIGLQTQQTLQIINKSAVKVDFEWRAFSTEKEESEKKNRLKQQLEEEEAEERMLLKEIVNNEAINEDFEIENGEDSDEEDRDEKAILQKRQKKAELMLARKYKDIRKAIEDDLLLFQDDIFSIEPIQGQIWPNSEMTITLTFQPKGAHSYTCPSFCNISCNQDRLALTLQGDGIGPKAFLNQNEINLGDPFVNEEVRPTIVIENQGEIECEFQLQPNERHFGKMFKFYPERGVLKVGERKEIKVEFSSSKPGEFKETFRWQLQGSSDFLSVLFIGHIRAPQFEFEREVIDFGKVSFNFPQEEKLKLTNKSTVPFDYNLRIPGDGKMKDKEFAIDRANGTIQAGETIEITIEFTPRYTKKYEMVLTIDIEGVAQDMKCLTIKAESEVPQVEIKPSDRLDFNEIFLRHRDIQGIQLINNSKLRAKFEVQEQKKESMVLAKYEVEPQTGIIEPGNTTTIQVKLFTNKLGDITLPLGVVIIGSNNNLPHIINIVASSIGPIVDVGGNLKELDFGQVDVLQDYSQKITITNKSKIEADFRAFTKNKISVFKPIQKHGLLKPQESMEVEVVCCADDAAKFQDVLHFVIKEGLDIDIVLKAKGIGSTIFCKEDLTQIDFQTLYTHKPKTREIFVENKGRKPQKLSWVRKQEKKKQAIEAEKPIKNNTLNNNNADPNAPPVEEPDIFSVVPDQVVLPPKHGIMFQFRAFSTKTGKQPEQFNLNSQIGNDRKVHQLYTTTVDGEFIKPTLKFSEKKLQFKYTWEKNVPFAPITKNLEIVSTSVLPTNFMLKYSPPFSISQENFQLLFGESATVKVDFDPGQKLDRVSGEQLGKLQIVHTDHPHREMIDLVGEVCFPNIKLEQTTVNFGAILNETSKKMIITMTNVSEMGLNYEWTFLEEELVAQNNDQMNRSGSRDSRRSGSQAGSSLPVPINEVFDILPLSGYLESGEVEQVEFVYNAFGGQKFKTTAVCHVDGGPNYEVVLVGDSSLITYKISTTSIDLGELRFCDWVSRDFYVENTGKVTFEYKVILDHIKRKGYIECSPQMGRIAGGEKQKITLKLCPVTPNDFKEIIQVQVGYFEPDTITLQGRGFYPGILVGLDRLDSAEYKTKFEEEFERKKNEREAQLKRAQLMAKAADETPNKRTSNVQAVQVKSIEQIQNEIQKEMDRQLFCTLINEQLEVRERQLALASGMQGEDQEGLLPSPNTQGVKSTSTMQQMNTTVSSKMHIGVENKLYEKIVLTTFVCDFGNVVINSVKQKSIRFVNVGPSPLEINFDTRAARAAGYTMPERPPKVLPNSDIIVKIAYTAKSKMKYGKNKCIVPVEIKNGARYNLEMLSNITIPEITLENVQDDCVDFGKVLCGQRKTFFIRFVNDKEIPCQWALNTRTDLVQDKKKEDNKFTISPTNGIIPSGSKQLIQLTFSPAVEKVYQHKFSINIQENHKPFPIICKGNGAQINLEFNPQLVQIGPVLPYDKFAHAVLEVTNPTPYPTELFNLDFDKSYLTEEEILGDYEDFETQDHLYVPVRDPGNPLWDFVKKSVDKRHQKQEVQLKLSRHTLALAAQSEYENKVQQAAQDAKDNNLPVPAAVEKPQILSEKAILTPDEKVDLEKQLEALSQIEKPPEYPDKVDDDKLHHVIILGHPGSGKTATVKHLAAKHQRFIASLDEAVEWAIQNSTEGGKKAQAYMETKNVEFENITAEREKLKKKAGKKAPELDAKWGPVNERQFKYLPEEILEECLRDRMKHPSCNAGLIFDGIESKYASSHLMAMKAIMRAVGTQSLQLLVFVTETDSEGYEIWKLIEWEGMDEALKQEEEALHKQKMAAQAQGDGTSKKKKPTSPSTNMPKEKETGKPPLKDTNFTAATTRKQSAKKENTTSVSVANQSKKDAVSSIKSHPTKKSIDSNNRRDSRQQAKDESVEIEEVPLFDLFNPGDYEDGVKKEKELHKINEIISIMKNAYTDKIENPAIYDPVFEEGKKEEKKPPVKKDAKGKPIIEEEPAPVIPDPIDYSPLLMRGPRIVTNFPLNYNMPQLYRSALEAVPAPVYPDPNVLPVPEPIYHQIITKPQRNIVKKRQEIALSSIIKNFEILTPINNPFKPEEDISQQLNSQQTANAIKIDEDGDHEADPAATAVIADPETSPEDPASRKAPGTVKRAQKFATQSVSISKGKPLKETSTLAQRSAVGDESEIAEGAEPPKPKYEFKIEDLNNSSSRWIIPGNKTLLLVVRFFTKKAGNYEGKLEFENFFGSKRYSIDVRGNADFPTISTLTKNLYWQFKKSRPTIAPDSYLSKVYVISENTFEFGPLLIGKNPDKRTDQDIRKVNSVTFRISNNGKYDAHLDFALLSSIKDNDPEYKKGVFWIEPESMTIAPSDIVQELRIWAIPNAAAKFKDEIIIMIKDNPTPVILPIQCLGSKPIVDVEEGEPVKFDRLLLNQSSRKEIRIRNNGQIPCRWKITGMQNLPEEFSLLNTEGELKPTQDSIIYVSFKAKKQQKFSQTLQLEVEDSENLGIKQEVKNIIIEAEAFDITVELKFPENNQENMLDFGAVRVGDLKDQNFLVKNIGLYKVQFSFSMKKKQFKDNFKIEPVKVELEPNQEKQILFRFCSQKEIRLNTTNSTTDITMEILEGKTLELYKPVPINVKVNSVFSKYSILPLKNINFGPIQFNDQKTLTFEIKNEGLFEFNYTVFNYTDDEFRKQLLEEQAKDKEARMQAVLGAAEPKDPKKAAKKEVKVEKKAAKGGKGQPVIENQLKVGQWAITPCKGTVGPDSLVTVEIQFSGNMMKLYEQKFAIDITGRDPEDQPKGILYETVGESCIPGINCDNFEAIFEEQIIVASMNANQNITSMINSNVFFYEEKTFFFGTLVPQQYPDGIYEKFKIINPNKIPCSVKFDVRKRNPTSTEPFAFEIAQKTAKIHPHEHTYVKIFFKPTIMAQYSGIFEALVENGEQNPKTYKLVFDLRGEGAMPTIKLEKPKEWFNDSTPLLKFPKVRVDKTSTLPITLKNDGQVPATVKWDLVTNENYAFLDQNSYTLPPKTYKSFNIQFKPKEIGVKQWQIAMQTLLNPYEVTKLMISGEGFYEDIVFESLPDESEDEVNLGDQITGQEKKIGFYIKNNKADTIKFNWNTMGCEDFTFSPRVGHLGGHTSKYIQMTFKGSKPTTHKNFGLTLETRQIKQKAADATHPYIDWDDSMKNVKYVTKTEYDWLVKKKAEDEQKRREEEALAAASNKKGAKKDNKAKKGEEPKEEKPPVPQPGERADIAFDEPVLEPENAIVEKTEKNVILKVSAVSDYARYEVESREIFFKSTLMYTSRTYQFKVKNTSLITIKYSAKIISYQDTVPITDPGFFYISPKQGSIGPNCDEVFQVKFSPTEVEETNERFLVISIENLEKGSEPLVIELEGEAERPVCHFELAPSNYREKKKPELDVSYNIIEFESLGTKVKNVKKFYVVNPTAVGYEFEWKKIEEERIPAGANIQNDGFFKCVTQKGVVLSGKKYEIIFEYTPDQIGTQESYWRFEIASQGIVQNFLVVGSVIEPNVFFDVGKVNFGPLLLGGKNKEIVHLKNLEEVPMSFTFDRESVKGLAEYAESIVVTPMSGVIKAQSELQIEIVFAPKIEIEYNYNLLCNIKRKSRPVSLNVKGIGYILHHAVRVQPQTGTVLDKTIPTLLELGNIYVNERRTRVIEIENSGEFNFDFSIKKSQTHLSFIQITPENGTVRQNEKFTIEVIFAPLADTILTPNKHQFTLSIMSGPTYTFLLSGSAKKPAVDLSFLQYDFGSQFVLKQPLPVTAFLEMRNRDSSAMSVETTFEKTNYLDVNLPPGQVILPLQLETIKDKKGLASIKETNVLKIPIIFTPRESKKYEEILRFDINGLYKIDVKITGEGAPCKLELEKSEDQNIDFGVVRVGAESNRTAVLLNLSKKPITLTFDFDGQLLELAKNFISVSPLGQFQVMPRERKEIELSFRPQTRLHTFRKDLLYKIVDNQEQRKLLALSATSHGVELKLMEDTIGFGMVVLHSKKKKRLQLSNLGDIGAKFEWDFTYCQNYFSITPDKGFLPPHEDSFFTITFHPEVVDSDIRFNNVLCKIDGSDSLHINLLGKCIPQPLDSIQDLKFATVVRTQAKNKVTLKNPSADVWRIKVSLTSNNSPNGMSYFTGKEILEIPPNQSADYEVIYVPLTMTASPDQPEIKVTQHEGTLFFPLPDGSALLYNLFGQASPPAPAQAFDITTKSKRQHTQIIPIQNWLKTSQRFQVTWIIEPADPSLFISGANTFDVAGESHKDYKLSLYALKPSASKITMIFKNPTTFEFIHFKINLTVQPPDAEQKIEMSAIIRETTTKFITLVNPLPSPIEIKKEMLISDNDNITFNPSSFTIPSNSEFGFEIVYRPLLVKEEASKVTLNSTELGQFVYPLQLKGVAQSTIQRNMTMKTSLGTDIIQSFKFINFCKKPTTYTCRVDKLGKQNQPPPDPKAKLPPLLIDFSVEQPSIIAPPAESQDGSEITLNIRFEPSLLGEAVALLIIQSPEGGEYNCLLNGLSTAPQPKGPFKISGAKPNPIDFKNPFFEPCEFTIRLDNPCFTCSIKNPAKIDAKKVLSIAIQYKAAPGQSSNGRLLVQTDKFDYPPWVFYLQGE